MLSFNNHKRGKIMKHINKLSEISNNYLKWNKARITCLSQILRSIIAVKTVNLSQIAFPEETAVAVALF